MDLREYAHKKVLVFEKNKNRFQAIKEQFESIGASVLKLNSLDEVQDLISVNAADHLVVDFTLSLKHVKKFVLESKDFLIHHPHFIIDQKQLLSEDGTTKGRGELPLIDELFNKAGK